MFQFAGGSTSTLPPSGEWRCLVLSEVGEAALRDGAWHSGPGRRERQGGVSSINTSRSVFYMIKVLLAIFVGLLRARPVVEPGEPAAVSAQRGV